MPFRQVAGAAAVDHHHRRAGRLVRWPRDHRAAGGERRRHFSGEQRRGEVPGGERGHDADRLARHLEASARHAALDDAAVDAPRLLGVPAELVAGEAPLALSLSDRLAGLGRDHPRRLVLAADHLVGDRHGVRRRARRPSSPARRRGHARPQRSPPRCRQSVATGASPSGFSLTGLMTGAAPRRRHEPSSHR